MEKREAVLIVEDSKAFSALLHRRITQALGLEAVVARTLAEAGALLAERAGDFCAALLDLNLPDAPDSEILDQVLPYGIPSIVFTGSFDDELRKKILARNVADYVLKEGAGHLEYLLKLISRLRKNRATKILLVDDSSVTRQFIMKLLRLRNFHALEASGGKEALALLELHPDVKMVLTDYHMPEMDGYELIRRIRVDHPRESLSIIGLSAEGSPTMSAQFLKRGANDFLMKPFVNEEFFCRVEQNLDLMDYLDEVRYLSQRDYLTGLSNRRHFFEAAPKLLTAAGDGGKVSVAMLDIDYFKKVNDCHGHDAGDAVLRHLAAMLQELESPRTLVSRFGGEEFCIMGIDDGKAGARLEALRSRVEASPARWQGREIPLTISLGQACGPAQELGTMLAKADELLYRAKTTGRNRLVAAG